MAKSFKQLSIPKAESAKRTSEKDLFDFLEDNSTTSAARAITGSFSNTSNTVLPGNISADDAIDTPALRTGSNTDEADVRQTFIIGQHYLDRLKNFVHTRRIQGQYDYTQKQALHEALDALFAETVIEPRPEYIRRQEDARKQKIRRGLTK